MKQERSDYRYRIAAWWTSGQSGIAKSDPAPNAIHFSAAPDGLEGRWTPEELLLASVTGCFTTTFQALALGENCDFIDLDLDATAKVDRVGSAAFFRDIAVHCTVTIANFDDCDRALKLLEAAEDECLIRRALDFPVKFKPHVTVAKVEHSS
jgi:organic hydroperoxide reductase OsmC/OhrA